MLEPLEKSGKVAGKEETSQKTCRQEVSPTDFSRTEENVMNYFNYITEMKVSKLLVCLLGVGMLCASCSEDDEKKVKTSTVTFEGSYWDSLIDNPQYGGPLLYGSMASTYHWVDEETQLMGGMTNAWGGQYGFAEGGIAISDYVSEYMDAPRDFNNQLEVPMSNGSKNFAMVYCDASMEFVDGKAHVIQSMDLCLSSYTHYVALKGCDFAKPLTGADDFLVLHIEADNGASITEDMVRGGKVRTGWRQIDLSGLGAVKSLSFRMTGSDQSEYGLNTPAYFAVDNIVVER